MTIILIMSAWTYQAINNKIYGTAKLTSTTFWNYYGGDDHKYNVLVTVTDKMVRN